MCLWIKEANDICNIFLDNNRSAIKIAAQEVFGSNLIIKSKKTYQADPENSSSPLKAHWKALMVARLEAGKSKKVLIWLESEFLKITFIDNTVECDVHEIRELLDGQDEEAAE